MKPRSRRPARDILSDVRSAFERWRRTRPRGTRIPVTLWRAAVEAAREHGVSKTAQALGLDYYGLRRRLESAPAAASAQPEERRFLEIALPSSVAPVAPECILELEDGQGSRLRVELKGAAPAELETLARAFWSVVR